MFDVTGNKSYLPGGSYHGRRSSASPSSSPPPPPVLQSAVHADGSMYPVFAGKDGSRGLAKSSVSPSDAVPQWSDLDAKEKGVLEDW